MRRKPTTTAPTAPPSALNEAAFPPPWRPGLGETVLIDPLNNKPGTVQAFQERIGNVPIFAIAYVNGVGSYIEDWFRADQLIPSA